MHARQSCLAWHKLKEGASAFGDRLNVPILLPRLLHSALLLQGVTGFGSSIALLSTWVVSRAIGIRACECPQWLLNAVSPGSLRNTFDKQHTVLVLQALLSSWCLPIAYQLSWLLHHCCM